MGQMNIFLPKALEHRIRKEAEQEKTTESQIIRKGMEAYYESAPV